MKIEYQLTNEDLRAAAKTSFLHNSEMSKGMSRQRLRLVGWAVFHGILLSTLTASWTPIVYCLLIGTFNVVIYPSLTKRNIIGAITRSMVSASEACLDTSHQVTLSENGIHVSCRSIEILYRWAVAGQVAETPEHLVILTSIGTALAVPRERLTSGDFDEFHAAVVAGIESVPSSEGDQ